MAELTSRDKAANLKRDGVQYIGFPAAKLVAKLVPASPLRVKQRNMVYVGALAYLFGIDMSVIKDVLEEVPNVRRDAGYPPLVTPSSQIVGTQAVFNVMMGRYKVLTGEFADLMLGYYGETIKHTAELLLKEGMVHKDKVKEFLANIK